MKEIKLRYIFEDSNGQKHVLTETIEQIENNLDIPRNIEAGWHVISRSIYTGRLDRNSREIYEGDRIKIEPAFVGPATGTIEWSDDVSGFVYNNGSKWALPQIFFYPYSVEVISPELIENPEPQLCEAVGCREKGVPIMGEILCLKHAKETYPMFYSKAGE